MSREQAWNECENALWSMHEDRCVEFNCGCGQIIQQIKGVLYV